MTINNPFDGIKIEFHIIQSFPVSCLNRDDVGEPKTAIVGGSVRARVSSQSWKRQVRLAMRQYGSVLGCRTKLISNLVATGCIAEGANDEQAKLCGDKIESIFIKQKETPKKPKQSKKDTDTDTDLGDDVGDVKQNKSDTLLFLSPNEVKIIAKEFAKNKFVIDMTIPGKDNKEQARSLEKLLKQHNAHIDAIDIALFGRMIAQAATMDVEAATSWSHALSTHKVTNNVDYFTALDDNTRDIGAAHIGSSEFNSATYYRYISLNLGQLYQTIGIDAISQSVEQFVKSLFVAVPNGKQKIMAAYSPWDFAKVLIRTGQNIQIPFETSIKSVDGGFTTPSIDHVLSYTKKQEKLNGSLYGKLGEYTYGIDDEFSVDNLISELKNFVESKNV